MVSSGQDVQTNIDNDSTYYKYIKCVIYLYRLNLKTIVLKN